MSNVGYALATTQDIGATLQPNCVPGFQEGRLDTPQEGQQTIYTYAVSEYGVVNVSTFGLESDLGQYAGHPT